MCGLTGVWSGQRREDLEGLALQMAKAIAHRGPDDAGAWHDEVSGIALGHRRLSIVDLSVAGHQPMHSATGRFVMVFNGEIYNHMTLRQALQQAGVAPAWQGHSDTETLLAAFEHWGVEPTLARCVGMFAIVLWDRSTRTLRLMRDRFGEKPLYYGWVGQGADRLFVFGSELKALRTASGGVPPVCREALADYFRYLYVPAPRTIYQHLYKLEPGCMLVVEGGAPTRAPAQALRPGDSYAGLSVRQWWSVQDAVAAGARQLITDPVEAMSALEAAMNEAVSLQSIADVPLGAFLSGGVDSSAIVALMQRQATRPIKTFTIGFDERGFDESAHALAVARHLGTEHHEMRVSSQMAQDVIPLLPQMYDEPFADSSQIPTYLICQAARQQVTVALSGDGGDELFGGYNRHFWAPRLWSRLGGLPYPLRQALSRLLSALPVSGWDALARPLGVVRPGEKLHKLARGLWQTRSIDDLYRNLVSEWRDPGALVVGAGQNSQSPLWAVPGDDDALRMMVHDCISYLPDDILCKVDRAGMATSLETRIPFLDHRVAELAWRLPTSMKIRGGQGKWILRQVLYQHVPQALIERPKAGFAIPVGQWLRGPLRSWADDLLNPDRMRQEGFLEVAPVNQVWREHLSGRYDHTPKLWSVLMFEAWLQTWGG